LQQNTTDIASRDELLREISLQNDQLQSLSSSSEALRLELEQTVESRNMLQTQVTSLNDFFHIFSNGFQFEDIQSELSECRKTLEYRDSELESLKLSVLNAIV
jgi:glutamate-1-semialdehyde aminotransferase